MKSKLCMLLGVAAALALQGLVAANPAWGQTNATIIGTIHDPSGAIVPGASLTAKSSETGAERRTTSNSSGEYEIVNLPAGPYDLTITANGFKTEVRKGIILAVGASVTEDFALAVGQVNQRVVVTGQTSQVDTATATVSGVVDEQQIRELPLNGRDWLQLATLQAGVMGAVGEQQTGGTSLESSSRAARGNGENLYISGNRPTSNVYMVDGLVINDYSNGSPGSGLNVNLGVDAVREFAVLTSDITAQYGMTAGGVVNSIYKSGTNELHGTAFGFFRNSAMDARNYFDGPSIPPFHRYQYGGALGGPIRKDKTFFFGSFEGLNQNETLSSQTKTLSNLAREGILPTGPVTIFPLIQPYLQFFPVSNAPDNGDGTANFIVTGLQVGHEYYAIGRIDQHFTDATQLSASYQWDTGGLTQPDPYDYKVSGDPSNHDNFVANLTHTFSSSLLNTARAGMSRTFAADSDDLYAVNPLDSNISLGFNPGLPAGGISAGSIGTQGGVGASGADIYHYTSYQASDDLIWTRGRQTLQFGGLFNRIDDNLNSVNSPLGSWAFGSIQDFLTDVPQNFTSDLPGTNGVRGLRSDYYGAYVQDGIRWRPNLTINVGLRYEFETPVSEAQGKVATLVNLTDPTVRTGGGFFSNPTKRNFSPRVGIAWDPTGNGRNSIRASYGIYDLLPLPYLVSQEIHSTPFYLQASVNNPPGSSFPTGGIALAKPTTARAAYVQQNPPRAYLQQWNLTLQHQFTPSIAVMIGYVGSHGVHLPLEIQDTDQVPLSSVTVLPDGHYQFPIPAGNSPKNAQRINPNFGRIQGMEWVDWSRYNGLLVNVSKRLSNGFAVQGAYTWSKSMDLGSHTFSSAEFTNTADPPYAFDLNAQRAVSDFNITNNMVVNTTWDIPIPSSFRGPARAIAGSWEPGGILQLHSGGPFTADFGTDRAFTGSSSISERPDLVPGCSNNPVNSGNKLDYINLSCFSYPAPGQLGDLGRNTLRGPGLESLDVFIAKNIGLGGERYKLQLRAEAFNVLNHTNFESATKSIFDSNGNSISSASQLTGSTLTSSRQLQLGLKLDW